MSEHKILELVRSTGIEISAGTLSNLLTASRAAFTAEARAVLAAGLASGPWQHLDDTTTRVNGAGQYCQILCNPLYTAYQTTPKKRLPLSAAKGSADRDRCAARRPAARVSVRS